ncbi:hypothetical protein L1987_04579 [Smallanthus sonchifolius]|uniref:Uncharacterized protein n=1 Tax=Smallanthus sonchifolius TaxID=185202 RepID=A0ACB9JT06_9ASTR|nr:hypothetical protein L1987_04579 [Smallanthus sonchifolius]
MKKAFRDIKRGVNKKVLKVPSIEQKVLDATSNESWGPHGTHLADIAQASRNYHEYQIIMSVVWKRLSDSGKNWRHVYKALTVLEYLVANGSERVIEDIREHAYQISNLVSFQYIDSTGRDQGSNVRKKSQSLVALVNDKEKIQEAREKAAASRDKFRNTPGGPGDDRYEGQYGSRDEDRNGYGREQDWNYRDSYGRDGEDRYGRDGYGEDEYRGKSQSIDGDYGAKSQSSDRDDGHHSSRGSNARVEDGSPDGSRLEPKLSGQSLEAPPTYEDAVTKGETPPPPPPPAANHQETVLFSNSAPPVTATPPSSVTTPPLAAATPSVTSNKETDEFDFFDPRGAPPAAPSASSSAEVDLFGSLSDSFSSDVLALVPSEPLAPTGPSPSQTFLAASSTSQQYDNPFGDAPFRAVPSTDVFSAQQSTTPFTEPPQLVAQTTMNDMGFGDGFDQTVDILAGILPPTGPPTLPSQTVIQEQSDQLLTQLNFPSQTGQPNQTSFSSGFSGQFGQPMSQPSYPGQFGQPVPQPAFPVHQSIPPPSFPAQGGQYVLPPGLPDQGSQPMLTTGFPAAQGGQSELSSGFPAQGSQSVLPSGFPSQGSQSMLPPGFPAAQGGQSELPSGFPAKSGQSVLPPGFPAAQGGQSELPSGFQAQGDQSVLPPGFPATQGGQSEFPSGFPVPQDGQSVLPPGFPTGQGGQSVLPSSFPAGQDGQSMLPPGFPAGQGGQSVLPPSFLAGQDGQSRLPPGFPAGQGGQSVLPPSFPAGQDGQSMLPPGFPAGQGGQSVSAHGFAGSQNASLGGISSRSGIVSKAGFSDSNGQAGQPNNNLYVSFQPQGARSVLPPDFPAGQGGQSVSPLGFTGSQNASVGGISSQSGTVSQTGFHNSNGQTGQPNNNLYGGFQPQGQPTPAPTPPAVSMSSFYQQPQLQSNTSMTTQLPSVTASTAALAIVPQQPAKEKFETKSTVWADTLNRGLVNLNISGSKTNPLSDIGIDFEAINRKEKRMEKPSKTPVTSNVTMGKAMGSGSGIGRAGVGALRPASNPMVGPGMGMGAPGAGPGFGGGYGVQPMGMNNMPQNMGMGMNNMPQNMGMRSNNMPQNMGMGMNNGQGFQMQPPPATGFLPPGNYNPMMGNGGGYGQQPYGGYR